MIRVIPKLIDNLILTFELIDSFYNYNNLENTLNPETEIETFIYCLDKIENYLISTQSTIQLRSNYFQLESKVIRQMIDNLTTSINDVANFKCQLLQLSTSEIIKHINTYYKPLNYCFDNLVIALNNEKNN